MDDLELKTIYNSWQKTVFGVCNKPFKYRKDFSNFEQTHQSEYVSLVGIKRILSSFTSIHIDNYFLAPYKVLPHEYEDRILKLDFYYTPKAIRLYKEYMILLNEREQNDVISNQSTQCEYINSLKRVRDYCVDKKIKLEEYCYNDTSCSILIEHYRQKYINIWVLIALRLKGFDLDKTLYNFYTEDEVLLMFNTNSLNTKTDDIIKSIDNKYKLFLISGLKKIYESIKKSIDEQ